MPQSFSDMLPSSALPPPTPVLRPVDSPASPQPITQHPFTPTLASSDNIQHLKERLRVARQHRCGRSLRRNPPPRRFTRAFGGVGPIKNKDIAGRLLGLLVAMKSGVTSRRFRRFLRALFTGPQTWANSRFLLRLLVHC